MASLAVTGTAFKSKVLEYRAKRTEIAPLSKYLCTAPYVLACGYAALACPPSVCSRGFSDGQRAVSSSALSLQGFPEFGDDEIVSVPDAKYTKGEFEVTLPFLLRACRPPQPGRRTGE